MMNSKIKSKLFFILFGCCCLSMTLTGQVENREHYIDQTTFTNTMSGILDGNVMGYQYSVGDESGVLFDAVQGNTRSAGDNGGAASNWSVNSQMMSASIAKMICTVAILDMLEAANIPGAPAMNDKLNLLLQDYLPLRWGSLIDGTEGQITLRHLLNHQSGFTGGQSINPKTTLSNTMNVALPDVFDYENANFNLAGFMVIYMTNPAAMSNLEVANGDQSDATYDANLTSGIRGIYQTYIQNNIFAPAGIVASCAANIGNPSTTEVYKYGAPSDNNGTDFGTVSSCMSNGWILSSRDMVNFVQQWTNDHLGNNILTAESIALMNDFPNNGTSTPLGWIFDRDTNVGEGYGHNGIWFNCAQPTCDAYTSSLVLTQDNAYMAINVNSSSNTANPLSRGRDLVTAYNAAVCASSITMQDSNMEKYNSASGTISTGNTANVSPGETTVFKAGSRVTLNPGFRAQSGAVFKAYIDSCNNLPTEVGN